MPALDPINTDQTGGAEMTAVGEQQRTLLS